MSLTSELNKARRKRLEEEENGEAIAPTNPMLYSRLNITAGKTAAQKDEDIAPVKDTTKSDERTWFQKGAFEDGYQFGDLTKTLYAAGEDIVTDVQAGIIGMGEKVVDAGAYLVGGAAKLLGNDEFADKTKDFIAKDLYDENKVVQGFNKVVNPASWINSLLNGDKMEENSVFGDKTDALVQSGGQLGATLLLTAAGVPAWVGTATTGVTSFGSEAENAFNQGATYGEAGFSAAITAGAEMLTEKISGGIKFGGKTLDDAIVKPLTNKISNQVARTVVNIGLDAAGEGFEEVVSEACSAIGQQLSYEREETIQELLSDEEAMNKYIDNVIYNVFLSKEAQEGYKEAALGGAILGGGISGVRGASSIATGRDYKTGLTSNEQKVLDREIANRTAEAESGGKKLTSAEKAKLREEALSDLKKGYISTDTIESALGGESYKAYQDAIAKDNEAIDKLKEIYKGEELDEAIRGITDNSKQGELKEQAGKEITDILTKSKDSYLSESYSEIERRKQAFEADISQYDAKQQETIKRAAESGILNNTRKTHEFVDMIAKISADKGVSFDFTNNAKLAETGFAVEGKTINGFVKDGTITTNIDSAKALNTVVGHEITHVLEGTEFYAELKKVISDYAARKGDYKDRLMAAHKLYKDIDGYKGAEGLEAIEREVVSDLVGEYLFTDADFVNSLSVKHRNVFQKIYDEIKYLYKMATAGSREARELEKVKRTFEQAYRGDAAKAEVKAETATETTEGTKYSLTPEQEEFFKDSKVRDENGDLKVMYHGTPNGDFTVFKDGTYFTDNKEYADRYQNPSASSIKSGKSALKPKTFEVYLDIKKPFDINDAEARDIYINDYIKGGNAMGINPYLPDSEYAKIKTIDWTEGEDLRDFLIENEYDYDGLVLDEGADGGYGEDVKYRGKSYVVFSPEQIKSVDNKKPTDNPDIRFSLSESVEETKNLMALHNLKADELLKSLDLGGLPMPSIAVIKADAGHDQYGDVSLILPKETIDPKANKANKVYGGDAWTPTYPKIEYKPSDAVQKRVSDKYYDLADKYGYDAAKPLYRYTYELEDVLNREGGEAALLESLYDSTDLMQAYLLDTGKGKVDTVQKEIRTELSDVEVDQHEFFVKELGADVINSVMAANGENPAAHKRQYWEKHGESIKETYKKLLTEKYEFTEQEVQNVFSGMKTYDFLKLVRDAYLYRKNGRVTVKTEADLSATAEAIKKAASEGYKGWVDGLFKGIEEKSGIRNNADYFTPSGNRRSWNALHWENTLENVVRAMRQQKQTGADALFAAHQIFATSAKEYKSIDAVKADSHRLRTISPEAYEEIKDSYTSRFTEIASRIANKGERNQFIALDNAMECIVDAVRSSKTKAGIAKNLSQYTELAVTEKDVADIVSLVADISNMPTGYFEAKPQRAVGFDEVGVFVIPSNADAKLKQELLNKGYSIAEYNPDVEGDRKRVVNSFEQYKFSLSDAGETPKAYGNYNVYGEDVRLEAPAAEDIAPTAETVSKTETAPETVAPMPENSYDEGAPIAEDIATALGEYNAQSLTDADAPPEMDAPFYGDEEATAADPFENRDIKEVGNRKVKAYMYENPEVKPFFQAEANVMLGELQRSTKGERFYNDELYYETNGEKGFSGTKRETSGDIEYLLDELHYTYAEIEKGLNAIIEDNGAENNACSKRIEFLLNDRLLQGSTDFFTGDEIPPNQDYINLLNEKQILEYSEEARNKFFEAADDYAPMPETAETAAETAVSKESEDIAPVAEQYEAIRPPKEKQPSMKRVSEDGSTEPKGKQRKWAKTSTESEAVDGKVLIEDLEQGKIHYQPIPNKVTLGNANTRLDSMGYETSLAYFNSQFKNKSVGLDDIALGERLIQEAIKRGDNNTAAELIQNVSILGTELGQKVQALSIIKRLTPEGQLGMLQKIVERGKTKGDKAYEGVEITEDMAATILETKKEDGTFDQNELNKAVEDVKQKIAEQMKVSKTDKVNAWRYLSMLGNPKTHIRNLVSNVAMKGTLAAKNAVARTIEDIAFRGKKTELYTGEIAPTVHDTDGGQTSLFPDPKPKRTKTWKRASEVVSKFAETTTTEMKDVLSDGGKYSEDASIKAKRATFKNKVLNGIYEFNSDLLTKEDWWFSKGAFKSALSEYLTANGISTETDIQNNPEIVEKAKAYATEQAQIATFRQYSWLANKVNEIERKNAFTNMAVGSIVPFKKTPINIAKAGLSYSPLGFAKTLTYDVAQVKNGKMEASEMVDHLAQNLTGTGLTLAGYMLAMSGFLNGAGDDDKEGKYDYQLGKQAYSINIGGQTFSLSWLSPIAMPLFVGANAYEQLVEGKEWSGDVVVETLAQTLDPLSEMSFLSSLDSVLSSYDSGIQKFAGIGETMAQNYITQFVPTLSSQIAATFDDTKRTTKVAGNSDFEFFDRTVNNLKYKIPGLRNTLEPTTDIWGNDVKQAENVFARAFENFLAPYARKESIATAIDEEIKTLYGETGDDGVIPNIPYNYVNYDGNKYEMSAEEYTAFKKTYGQTACGLMEALFGTDTYRNATSEERAEMVGKVYDYARDEARKEYFAGLDMDYTNAKADGEEVYKENPIKGAIEEDLPVDEYTFAEKYPEKYSFFKENGISYDTYKTADEDGKRAYTWAYENPEKLPLAKAVAGDVVTYRKYASELYDIKADKDENGKTISGSRKEKVIDYINNMDADYGTKIILFKSEYNADDTYNQDIIDYLNSREDISYKDMETILKELGFTVHSDGRVTW